MIGGEGLPPSALLFYPFSRLRFGGNPQVKDSNMVNFDEELEVLSQREDFYRFLSRIYYVEVDEAFWSALTKMEFPAETGDEDMDRGYRMMRGYLAAPGDNPLEDLAVDYARIFLAAGIYEGNAAVPFESVYTSKEHLIMQDAWEDIVARYNAKGVEGKDRDLPEDQLGLELEFMAKLVAEGKAAAQKGDEASLKKSLAEQLDFVSHHIDNWMTPFCEDVQKCPGKDFYKGAAFLTKGFIRMDAQLLKEDVERLA